MLQFLDDFIKKFGSLKRFLKQIHVWQHLLILFVAGLLLLNLTKITFKCPRRCDDHHVFVEAASEFPISK